MPRARTLLFALALGLPLAACSGPKGPSPEELARIIEDKLEAANNMRAGNKIKDAEEQYKWVISQDDANPGAWYGLGRVRVEQGNLDEARKLFEKAVALAPTDRAAQEALGMFLARQGEHAAAVTALAVAYGDALEDVKVGLAYGVALRESGKLDEAEKVLRAVAEEDEHINHVYTEIGDLLRSQKRTDEALKAYLKAQKLHPSDTRAQAGAALVYEDQGRFKHAADAWSLYVRMDCCTDYSKTVAQPKLKEMEQKEQAAIDAAAPAGE